jgi:hypothetical protein
MEADAAVPVLIDKAVATDTTEVSSPRVSAYSAVMDDSLA